MKSKIKRIISIILAIILVAVITVMSYVLINMLPKDSSDKTNKYIVIESGMSRVEIADLLEEKGIIKNGKLFYYYTKIKKATNIYAATYKLSPSMSPKKVLKVLLDGGTNTDTTIITFKEGLNMRQIAKVIEETTDNSYDDVMNKLNDQEYLDTLIEKYWFLTDTIKNENIYYSLEGYLFPDTYEINNDATVEDIFKVMLDKMEEVLNDNKEKIENSNYSVHEILTLASVIQLEGYTKEDFRNVASTLFNRLNNGMDLGSCVTSYYGVKKDMADGDLYQTEIDDVNPYNTRAVNMEGKLPIGPISNPSLSAIEATLNPIETDYFYFVSDKDNNLYFNSDFDGHEKTIAKLQNEGMWYEW